MRLALEMFLWGCRRRENETIKNRRSRKEVLAEIPKHFQKVKLGEYIVMPNHVHGIIILSNVGTCHGMSLQRKLNTNKFSEPISSSLSTIINQYKSAVTRRCRQNGYHEFAWQPRFYEHIIRSEESLEKVREYILNNPIKWELDEYYPGNRK